MLGGTAAAICMAGTFSGPFAAVLLLIFYFLFQTFLWAGKHLPNMALHCAAVQPLCNSADFPSANCIRILLHLYFPASAFLPNSSVEARTWAAGVFVTGIKKPIQKRNRLFDA